MKGSFPPHFQWFFTTMQIGKRRLLRCHGRDAIRYKWDVGEFENDCQKKGAIDLEVREKPACSEQVKNGQEEMIPFLLLECRLVENVVCVQPYRQKLNRSIYGSLNRPENEPAEHVSNTAICSVYIYVEATLEIENMGETITSHCLKFRASTT